MPEKESKLAKSLYKKLVEIMSEMGRVEKKGYNAFHKYSYVTESDLTDALRDKLASRNIIIIPSLTDVQHEDTLTTVRMTFSLIDAESGERHDVAWAGTGDDKSDKGIYKGYTGSLKYFLMKTFLVSQGDDPEGDEATDKRAESRSQHVGVSCPECHGPMWDNRESKRNPKAPDYKCKNKACNGAVWEDSQATTESSKPAPDTSQESAAVLAFREQIKGAAQALNDGGDVDEHGEPKWTVQSINALAREHFDGPVATLGEKHLGELAEMFSQRLEAMRKGATERRTNIIASIESEAGAEISAYLKQHHDGKSLEELTTAELVKAENELTVPF
jgi:hypothetical protein